MTEREFYEKIGGDYQEAIGRLMKDTLIRKFVLRFPADPSFEGLRAALDAENWDEAFTCAHTLKGVALNLAFARLSQTAVALTDALRPQNREQLDLTIVRGLFAATADAYQTVIDTIRELEAA